MDLTEIVVTFAALIAGMALPLTRKLFPSQRQIERLKKLSAIHNSLENKNTANAGRIAAQVDRLCGEVADYEDLVEKQSRLMDDITAFSFTVAGMALSTLAIVVLSGPVIILPIVLLLVSLALGCVYIFFRA